MHSHAFAINSANSIAGSSWTLPGNTPGDKLEQAFVWRRSRVEPVGTLQPGWCSRPSAINDGGVVVGHSWHNGWPPRGVSRGFVWHSKLGLVALPDFGKGCVPIDINNGGTVVGFVTDANNKTVSVAWPGKSELALLPLPVGSIVMAINNRGDLGYNRETDGGVRAFVWIQGLGEVTLPTYRGHRSEIRDLLDDLTAVGMVFAGRHSHAVRWLPLAELTRARSAASQSQTGAGQQA